VERHLQNWVAKRIYTEVVLLSHQLTISRYFFLGSVIANGRIDSASRGIGLTLSKLIEEFGSINARIGLLYTFDTPWRDIECGPPQFQNIRRKTYRFINFYKLLRIRSVEKNFIKILSLLSKSEKEISDYLSKDSIKL
jgi:hypothetical protein